MPDIFHKQICSRRQRRRGKAVVAVKSEPLEPVLDLAGKRRVIRQRIDGELGRELGVEIAHVNVGAHDGLERRRN